MESGAETRIFTIPEANETLTGLRRTLPSMRRRLLRIERMENRLEVLDLICDRSVSHTNPDLRELLSLRVRYHRALAGFEEILRTLERQGYLLRDLDKGVVHFLGRLNEERVLLCWREGEREITHWHPIEGESLPDEKLRRPIGDD
jgi:hypothetical protein